ncbi:hypothetical protein BDP55DRAFT_274001 [Colletotrichum godetiae]|uniref:Uncharacterized protein n=1 Tax=Colletotrichum godetiae TaxID=1209918 RepID=A0AAJ0AE32_9PEZI|nr:uncharacterized protein BDP55DRAFT_274001 [Colletotrichum godetiae]KAK1672213.1 hypothetical protein BDP55DRAFT_274001 [Colletotrichum godetiae]
MWEQTGRWRETEKGIHSLSRSQSPRFSVSLSYAVPFTRPLLSSSRRQKTPVRVTSTAPLQPRWRREMLPRMPRKSTCHPPPTRAKLTAIRSCLLSLVVIRWPLGSLISMAFLTALTAQMGTALGVEEQGSQWQRASRPRLSSWHKPVRRETSPPHCSPHIPHRSYPPVFAHVRHPSYG